MFGDPATLLAMLVLFAPFDALLVAVWLVAVAAAMHSLGLAGAGDAVAATRASRAAVLNIALVVLNVGFGLLAARDPLTPGSVAPAAVVLLLIFVTYAYGALMIWRIQGSVTRRQRTRLLAWVWASPPVTLLLWAACAILAVLTSLPMLGY